MNHSIDVWRADWLAEQASICDIRYRVFVEEQRVPEALEWDGLDDRAIHILGRIDGGPACGTGRLLTSGQIGRMAVLPAARGRGLGGRLLTALLAAADTAGIARVFLHGQLPALDFYRRFGFEPVGAEFMEAGIRHRIMERRN